MTYTMKILILKQWRTWSQGLNLNPWALFLTVQLKETGIADGEKYPLLVQVREFFGVGKIVIVLFYVAALYLSVVYIQLAVSDIGIYGGLFFSSLPLVKPKRLTKDERSNFNLPEDLKNISVGLILG